MAARRLPVLAQYRDDAVTRLLCAGAHLDEGFAREVDVELTEDRLHATGLSLGIDLVALARHARASVRRTDLRDRRLAGLCAAGVWAAVPAALYGLVAGLPALALSATAAFVLAYTTTWVLVRGAEDAARTAALGVEHGAQRPKDLAPVAVAVAAGPEELHPARLPGPRRQGAYGRRPGVHGDRGGHGRGEHPAVGASRRGVPGPHRQLVLPGLQTLRPPGGTSSSPKWRSPRPCCAARSSP
ncbi:hypothetical protein ACIF8W_29510 [Streptomyces sp. NPDC085639]|uniref:hypothetical protein n=1 Tax=Streptomyces sp. NPDC085639 TaxID=3365734 RepID=UPI0037D9248B